MDTGLRFCRKAGWEIEKICNPGILAVWKRNRVWNWYVFILGKSHMDCIFWLGNGTWKSDSWLYMVYYDSWNSVWKAVFQDGKTFFHAIWCQCNRVEYKNLRRQWSIPLAFFI